MAIMAVMPTMSPPSNRGYKYKDHRSLYRVISTYTFTADYIVDPNAQTRNDVGLWISTDGGDTANSTTGECSVANLDTPPAFDDDNDAVGDVQKRKGDGQRRM